MGTVDRVRQIVLPIVERDGAELYDIEHESGVLRVMVDRPGGIDVDTIGDISQHISQALDADDPLPDSRYLLEVTSPGIERKLRTPEHFRAQVGEDVAIKVHPDVEGARRFDARLESADDDGIEVVVSHTGEPSRRRLGYAEIESARRIFRWGEQTTSPGKSKSSNSKTTNKKASAR